MLSAVVTAAAIVLAVAGIAKIRHPDGTADALRNAGLPGNTTAVRVLGGVEIALAAVVVATGSPVALGALACAYAGFAGFSARLRARQGSAASCGCFGASSSPVHPIHVVLNLSVAACVAASIRWPPESFVMTPIAVFVAAGVLAATLVIALTLLPELLLEATEILAPDEP
ncbi:MAG: hypothetical protein JST73_07955 [Actinobacteria bacterium]|nr:hypothetical protein [Actinomycetota bacterium]